MADLTGSVPGSSRLALRLCLSGITTGCLRLSNLEVWELVSRWALLNRLSN